MTPKFSELLQEFQAFARSAPNAHSLMEHIATELHTQKARYNWVGFYLTDKAAPGFLSLGPYAGSFTPQVRISFEQGLCGAAATFGKTVVVNEVVSDPRYLQGSELVKSEMVAPIFARSELAGEIDVNSYFAGTFSTLEQSFVESCAALVGKYFEQNR